MKRVFKAAQITDKVWIRKVVEIQGLVAQYLDEMKLDFKKRTKEARFSNRRAAIMTDYAVRLAINMPIG